MSLLCGELEIPIPFSEKAYVVMHPLGEGYAVSGRVIDKVPEADRRSCVCDRWEEGFNVFDATGTKGAFFPNWQSSTLRRGKFLFSLSEESVNKYLPKTRVRIATDIAEGAH